MSCMIMSDNAFYQIAKFYESVGRFLPKAYLPSFYDVKKSALEMASVMKRMNYEAYKIRYGEGYTEDEIRMDEMLCEDYKSIDYPRLILTMKGFAYQCYEGDVIPADVDIIHETAKFLELCLTTEEINQSEYGLWY